METTWWSRESVFIVQHIQQDASLNRTAAVVLYIPFVVQPKPNLFSMP